MCSVLDGTACANIKIPWWWHPWSGEACRKENCVYRICLLLSAWTAG